VVEVDIDWKLAVAIMAVLVSIGTAIASRSRDRRTKTAELVRTYTRDLYANREVLEMFQDIDQDRFDMQLDELVGAHAEIVLVQLLDHLNSIAHNTRRGVLSLRDIMPTTIAYAIVRTWENDAVRRYLRQVRVWDRERFVPGYGFRYFEELAIEISAIRDAGLARSGHAHEPLSAPARVRPFVRLLVGNSTARRLASRNLRRRAAGGRPKNPAETE
jgi:hypothetical protein